MTEPKFNIYIGFIASVLAGLVMPSFSIILTKLLFGLAP